MRTTCLSVPTRPIGFILSRHASFVASIMIVVYLNIDFSGIAQAQIKIPTNFDFEPNAVDLPMTGPNAWCRKLEVITGIINQLSTTDEIKEDNETIDDFTESITIKIDPVKKTATCHGVAHISNGQTFAGTFEILNAAPGAVLWRWTNDEDIGLDDGAIAIKRLNRKRHASENRQDSAGDGHVQWIVVSGAYDYPVEYVDKESITRQGNLGYVWAMQDFPPITSSDGKIYQMEQFKSVKYKIVYDCDKDLKKALYHATYSDRMGGGVVIDGGEQHEDWSMVQSDEKRDEHIACGRQPVTTSMDAIDNGKIGRITSSGDPNQHAAAPSQSNGPISSLPRRSDPASADHVDDPEVMLHDAISNFCAGELRVTSHPLRRRLGGVFFAARFAAAAVGIA